MAWLTGWNRRKSKIVNGSTAGTQINYQMQLIVHKGSGADTSTDIYLGTNVRNDFGDVRFTKSDGSSLLNYWIESYISGTSAIVWIQIDSIPASPGTSTIYIYYDNPLQTTTGNGTQTFYFYDDFETYANTSELLASWSGSGTIELRTDISYRGTKSVRLASYGAIVTKPFSAMTTMSYMLWVRPNGSDINMGIREGVATKAPANFGWPISGQVGYNAGAGWISSGATYTNNQWYKVEIIADAITDKYSIKLNDSLIVNNVNLTSVSTQFDIIKIGEMYGTELYADTAIIRKYISPEPTWSCSGGEEVYTISWLSGWNRRKSKIVNGSTSSQTNYQMRLTVHKATGSDTSTDIYLDANVRNDFGDVRFTKSDESSLLNYWIESYISGVSAIVWIQIDSITASPCTSTIYIYYDNSSQTSVSNGNNTFEFFDDFLGSSLGSAWTPVSGASVANSILTLSSATNGQVYTDLIFNPGIVMRTKEKRYGTVGSGNRNTDSAFHDNTWRNSYDSPNVVTAGTDYNTGKGHIFWSRKAGSGIASAYNSTLVDDGANWHIVELTWSNNLVKFMWDNNTIGSSTDTTYIPVVPQRLQFDIYTNSMDVDWVTVRKYASPEPTFGLSSAEESNITAIAMTLSTNTCAGPCSITADVTWQNLSASSITFRPAILINGITIVNAAADITIAAGVTGSSLITTPTLSIGTHSICPYPN